MTTSVSEQLLAVLKLCLLALIYLFFLRVLRAVWVEVHGPRRTRPARPAPVAAGVGAPAPAVPPHAGAMATTTATRALRIVEPPALRGRSFVLAGELTLGRAPGCDVELDDTYVSQVHARVAPTPEGAVVDDCNSTNGTYVNQVRVLGPTTLHHGDRLQVGNVILELA